RDTDEALTSAFTARKRHRDRKTTQPFYDSAYYAGRYPPVLPDPLSPKPGGLTTQQVLRISFLIKLNSFGCMKISPGCLTFSRHQCNQKSPWFLHKMPSGPCLLLQWSQ